MKRKLTILKIRLLIIWYSLAAEIATWLFFNIGLSRRETLPNEAAYQMNAWIWSKLYVEGGNLDKLKYHYKWELEKRIKYYFA
jgi:hypothetical protein